MSRSLSPVEHLSDLESPRLGDQIHGTACVQKILNSSFVEQGERDSMAEQVRTALLNLRVSAIPAYRKLVEELGMQFQGPTSTAPSFPSAPTLQPQQQPQQPHYHQHHQQAPQQQQQWMQPCPPAGPYAMPYGAEFGGFTNGGYPPYQPQYSQVPTYSFYQPAPPVGYPYSGSPYLSPSPGPNLVGGNSPLLSSAPPFSPHNFDGFSPFSPLGSPSGGMYMNPSASFSVSSDGGLYDREFPLLSGEAESNSADLSPSRTDSQSTRSP